MIKCYYKYKKHNIVFVVDASYIQLLKNIFEEKNIPLFKCEEKGIYTILTNRLFLKVSGVFCLVFIIFIFNYGKEERHGSNNNINISYNNVLLL